MFSLATCRRALHTSIPELMVSVALESSRVTDSMVSDIRLRADTRQKLTI